MYPRNGRVGARDLSFQLSHWVFRNVACWKRTQLHVFFLNLWVVLKLEGPKSGREYLFEQNRNFGAHGKTYLASPCHAFQAAKVCEVILFPAACAASQTALRFLGAVEACKAGWFASFLSLESKDAKVDNNDWWSLGFQVSTLVVSCCFHDNYIIA